jgi:co-chaperonin GroES (HSP10)
LQVSNFIQTALPIDLKTGDRVQFGKWSGTEVKIDGVAAKGVHFFSASVSVMFLSSS